MSTDTWQRCTLPLCWCLHSSSVINCCGRQCWKSWTILCLLSHYYFLLHIYYYTVDDCMTSWSSMDCRSSNFTRQCSQSALLVHHQFQLHRIQRQAWVYSCRMVMMNSIYPEVEISVFVSSFVRSCGQGSSLLWTPSLRHLSLMRITFQLMV